MKVESLSEDGEFSGYAAIFGNVDSVGDVIEKGALTKTQVKRMRRNEMLVNTEFDVQKIESNFYATKSYYYLLFRPLMRLTCTKTIREDFDRNNNPIKLLNYFCRVYN